jgi:PAS domain-containing protein
MMRTQESHRSRGERGGSLERTGDFTRIYGDSPLGTKLCDPYGRLIDANRAYLEAFGLSDISQLRGFHLFEHLPIPDEKKLALRQGRPVRCRLPFDFERALKENIIETQRMGKANLDLNILPLCDDIEGTPMGYLVHLQEVKSDS